MANPWIATDDFSSYSNGASLNGGSGGSGWNGNWSVNYQTATVENTPTPGSPAKSVYLTGAPALGVDFTRAITGIASGIVRIYFYATNVPTGTKGYYPIVLQQSGTSKFYLEWGGGTFTGNTIGLWGSGTPQQIGSGLSAAAWHYVDIDFGSSPNQARAALDGGAWSPYVTATSGSFSTIDGYRCTTADGNSGDPGYYIGPIGPKPAPAIASAFFMAAAAQ